MAGRAQRSRTPAPRRPRTAAATSAPLVGQLVGPVVAVVLDPAPLVQAAWWADPPTRRGPLLIAHPGGHLLAACPRAAGTGLRPGQTLAQARLRCPQARVAVPDRGVAAALWRAALRALSEEVGVTTTTPGKFPLRIHPAVE